MADKRPTRTEEQLAEYYTQPADGVMFISHEQPDTVTPDELIQISMDIAKGAVTAPADFDAAHREAWERLVIQIKEIEKRGGIVDIPSEIP